MCELVWIEQEGSWVRKKIGELFFLSFFLSGKGVLWFDAENRRMRSINGEYVPAWLTEKGSFVMKSKLIIVKKVMSKWMNSEGN